MSRYRVGQGAGSGMDHVPSGLVERYVAGGSGLGAEVVWAVELHLESCAGCRDRLGEVVARRSPQASCCWSGCGKDWSRSWPAAPGCRHGGAGCRGGCRGGRGGGQRRRCCPGWA
jgi:hypothetical protein